MPILWANALSSLLAVGYNHGEAIVVKQNEIFLATKNVVCDPGNSCTETVSTRTISSILGKQYGKYTSETYCFHNIGHASIAYN